MYQKLSTAKNSYFLMINNYGSLEKSYLFSSGVLKIAEVASRFKNLPIEEFIDLVNQYGFKIKWKETKHEYFYLMDFKRVSICKKKLPDLKLKPCFYKKR